MSSIVWHGNRLIQRVGNEESELGYVALDKHTRTYVLWLKDHVGVFAGKGAYVRAETWSSRDEAKEKAAASPSTFLAHLVWMRNLESKYGFLAMKYGDHDLEHLATFHIKPALAKELNYEVRDLRDVARAGIIDEIMRSTIKGAHFVIADLTHDNNGAYWEAGFAEGLGIPVIYVCESKKFDAMSTHFDTNHLTTVPWRLDDIGGFTKELVDTVRRTMKDGRRARS